MSPCGPMWGQSREAILAEVSQDGSVLKHLPLVFRRDFEVALAAVTNSGQALEYVADDLLANREIVLAAVIQKGWALMYADAAIRADREVVLTAVKQDGSALWFASQDLRADREVVLAAVNQKGWALMYAAEELKRDKKVVYAAWCRDKQALTYASEVLASATPCFRFVSGEQVHLKDGSCGTKHVVEVKQQLESQLRCRIELVHEGKILRHQEDRPLALFGGQDLQIVKLPQQMEATLSSEPAATCVGS